MIRPSETIEVGFPTDVAISRRGLVIDAEHGRLAMAKLPTLPILGQPGEASAPVDPALPGGIASAGGRVFWVDQGRRSVEVVECDGTASRFGCIGGRAASRLTGLAATRNRLNVAEYDAGRVVAFDLERADAVGLWSGLDRPRGLAAAPTGEVYVGIIDGVRRLEPDGSSTLIATVADPWSLAWEPAGEHGSLLITAGRDREASVYRLMLDATPADPWPHDPGDPLDLGLTDIVGPLVVGRVGAMIMVAVGGSATVEAFDAVTLSPLGSLGGEPVEVIELVLDVDGELWVTDGSDAGRCGPPVPVTRGSAEIGPIPLPAVAGVCDDGLLRLKLAGLFHPGAARTDAMLRPDRRREPRSPAVATSLDDRLLVLPGEATEAMVTVELVAGTDEAGRPFAPWIDRLELRINEAGPIDHLPQIYRSQGSPEDFLDPFLRLLGSGFDDVIGVLLGLPDQFDPETATDDLDGQRWLDWLATWVDACIDETWPIERRRRAVAEAFERNGRRGTAEAIRHRIELEFGIEAQIIEPADLASVWVLGAEETELGLTSMLGAAPAAGSIVDHTAVIDRSHLIGPTDLGAPLFGDLANRFTVVVPATVPVEAVEAVVERRSRPTPESMSARSNRASRSGSAAASGST